MKALVDYDEDSGGEEADEEEEKKKKKCKNIKREREPSDEVAEEITTDRSTTSQNPLVLRKNSDNFSSSKRSRVSTTSSVSKKVLPPLVDLDSKLSDKTPPSFLSSTKREDDSVVSMTAVSLQDIAEISFRKQKNHHQRDAVEQTIPSFDSSNAVDDLKNLISSSPATFIAKTQLENKLRNVEKASMRKPISFHEKEKRKRNIGQCSRAKNYVEEEKRILRQSGFD